MADYGYGVGQHQLTNRGQYGQYNQNPGTYQVVKAATSATAGGSLLVLSGLTLTGTTIALVIATPLLVIFSPVLVPAAITAFLLAAGFLASGGFGVAGLSVLAWIYRFMTGQHPVGADQLELAKIKLAGKGRDIKDTAQHYGQEEVGGGGGGGGRQHTGSGTTTGVRQTTTTT